jgi:hypothetical protein
MHVLSTIDIELGVVEDAEVVVHGSNAGGLLAIEFLEGFESFEVVALGLVVLAELLEDHGEVVFDSGGPFRFRRGRCLR